MHIEFKLDDSLKRIWQGEAVLAVITLRDCRNEFKDQADFQTEWRRAADVIRAQGKSILTDPMVLSMRATFNAMPEMDPTRYRPSSEALLRRCLEGAPISICPLVDVNNLLSLSLRVPLGIYDLDRIESRSWTYRLGFAGEEYLTFSNKPKNAAGKLVIADNSGVIGGPVADSGRAPIGPRTTNVAVVAYLPLQTSASGAQPLVEQIQGKFSAYIPHRLQESRTVLI